ncbi:39S ribosomal protein L38, mitochondrial [Trachymyrmex septentrionalis]|uniref:Large ribosomal subunit protein mL38 n=1 Tax=Trachymyrmex septentrionalis TaxID=34720 RepID=A0A151JXM6_9HYME|nr:PREDICTED: 39S ribosomal protein L38, mitochondrial [Trachymyrmex septentrionalis]KYN39760.1 39S ribosomal protein L38, mitochondrial [Trachymyrmex septentrionalis]
MSIKLLRCFANDFIPKGQHVRHGHRIRGKPPTIARTLKQRLEELNREDPTLDFKVNIGYLVTKTTRRSITSDWMNAIIAHRNNAELEKSSRARKLLVDLKTVKEDWLQIDGPSHIHRIAKHYGVYNDLYGDAYFMPVVPLNISYDLEDDKLVKVYTGNVIKPSEASKAPDVTYDAEDGTLWSLIMCTPDGNLTSKDNEYCHWFIGNIPGNRLKEGEELVDYLQPIAPYGIGYCRYIFVLYKQNHSIDFSEYKKTKPCLNLEERNWRTLDFYRKYQDQLTPAGLAFFQSDWDHSLKEFYYNTLKMRVPIFQYDFPKPYIKKQKWFPLKEPFNIYLDKYRDPKQIKKEFLLRKLKKVHPFDGPEPPRRFPLVHSDGKYIPSWLKFEIIKKRLGYGHINDLDEY